MASTAASADVSGPFPLTEEPSRPWRAGAGLSSLGGRIEAFLAARPFERGTWLAVAFAMGIAAWFVLPDTPRWLAVLAGCGAIVLGALAGFRIEGRHPYLRSAQIGLALMAAAGLVTVWSKSTLAGAVPIDRPAVVTLTGRIVAREERGAEDRVRLTLVARGVPDRETVRVRVNLVGKNDSPALAEGAVVRLKARLMPPAPPMLPGAYDFARAAWFMGLSATGSVLGRPQVVVPVQRGSWLGRVQRRLSRHVRERLDGSPGAIAAAFASGDRGAIAIADEDAMRDSGLSHLLSISGLHVSAVVGAAYILAIRLLALWPWLALRIRLPLAAAASGALVGIAYTLLTGAEVPTIRSCIGAVLVLIALALGRDPLSMRMIAVAAFVVMLFWPEAVVGPSFQMSFAAVIAIVALHSAAPVQRFLKPREEAWPVRLARLLAMLLLTGVVIELALMPIGLFHFHRAGVYGALANVVAIPLTTFVSMPLIALALLLDLVGLGTPAWWAVGKSLELLIALAHWTARQPGSVALLPGMGRGIFALFVAGGLWLALWSGRVRLWGLAPVLIGCAMLVRLHTPDVLVSGDGRHVAIVGERGELLVLRESRSDFAVDNLREHAGLTSNPIPLAKWPGAQCSADFCVVTLERDGRRTVLLLGRGRERIDERALAAACERADVVISERWLPRSCRPRQLKADRALLWRSGGLGLDLRSGRVTAVASTQGTHGWWRPQLPVWRRKPEQGGGASPVSAAMPQAAPAQ
ncbi:MAG: ComEC/Rec2 family competence protein [Novosphingobium sp.]|nr:ComEC/Rec2 family competence protein [Novosphingobium sp.]